MTPETTDPRREWLILDPDGRCYWCEGGKGYSDVLGAGLFTTVDADRIVSGQRGDRKVHVSDKHVQAALAHARRGLAYYASVNGRETTDPRIAEIRAREQRAAKGPWRLTDKYPMMIGTAYALQRGREIDYEAREGVVLGLLIGRKHEIDLRDWEFIAHARADVPFLLDALASLQQRVEALTQATRRACSCEAPDPVMQADGKFYCYACSFETGARPNSLEPENWFRAKEAAEATIARLSAERDVIRKFSELHDGGCQSPHGGKCSCGWNLIEARIEEAEGEGPSRVGFLRQTVWFAHDEDRARVENLLAAFDAALAALPSPPVSAPEEECTWKEDADGVSTTACGHVFALDDSSRSVENGFRFCHFCGKRIRLEAILGARTSNS